MILVSFLITGIKYNSHRLRNKGLIFGSRSQRLESMALGVFPGRPVIEEGNDGSQEAARRGKSAVRGTSSPKPHPNARLLKLGHHPNRTSRYEHQWINSLRSIALYNPVTTSKGS